MRSLLQRSALAGGLLVLCGCIAPDTQMPQLMHRPPDVERRSYSFHDPYPDVELAPDMDNRPRGFDEPRTNARRSKENRALVDLLRGAPAPAPAMSPLSSAYPRAVR